MRGFFDVAYVESAGFIVEKGLAATYLKCSALVYDCEANQYTSLRQDGKEKLWTESGPVAPVRKRRCIR